MARLSDLPNELIVEILKCVFMSGPDADAFNQVSKQIRVLASPLLPEHLELKRKYKTWKNFDNTQFSTNPPADLLGVVVDDARVASYVTALHLKRHKYWDSLDGELSDDEDLLKETALRDETTIINFRTAIKRCDMLSDRCKRRWILEAPNFRHSRDQVIALLFPFLPNLETLSLECCIADKMMTMVESIGTMTATLTFAKLKVVILRGLFSLRKDNSRTRIDYNSLLYAFLSLPSLERFSMELLDLGRSKESSQGRSRKGMSSVTHLKLINCPYASNPYTPDILADLILSPKCLTSFVYHAPHYNNEDHWYDSGESDCSGGWNLSSGHYYGHTEPAPGNDYSESDSSETSAGYESSGNDSSGDHDLVESGNLLEEIETFVGVEDESESILGQSLVVEGVNTTGIGNYEANLLSQCAPRDQSIINSIKNGHELPRNDGHVENEDMEDSCSLREVRTLLLNTVRTTLRHLTIFAPENQYLGSLKAFRALESLVTDRALLLESGQASWAKLFPPAIRSLTIYDNHYNDPGYDYSPIFQDEIIVLLEDLLRTKRNELPDLGTVNYFLSRELPRRHKGLMGVKNYMSTRVVKKLEKRFSKFGMQLSLRDEYHPYWERVEAKKMPWARSWAARHWAES